MDEIKNFFIAFILIFLILVIWQYLFLPKPQPKIEKPKEEVREILPVDTLREIAIKGEEIILENNKVKLIFSNFGGILKSVYLKDYDCELLRKGSGYFGLTLFSKDKKFNFNSEIFKYQKKDNEIIFEGELENYKIIKRYQLKKDYNLSFTFSCLEDFNYWALTFEPFLNFTEKDTNEELDYANYQYYFKNQLKNINFKRMKKDEVIYEREVAWLTMKNKYFLFAFFPNFYLDSCQFLKREREGGIVIYSKEKREINFSFLFAPLDYNFLKSFKKDLEKAVPLGWPKPFSLGILFLLKFLYKIFQNYGLAIIMFALLMKLLFFPFSRLQNEQIRKMQLLQPKLEELKRKYKDDPQTLNRETMQLYQLYKINPFTGCLPFIIQLPVFWALYSVFRQTIDLRKAHFIFWIKDLSVKDPIYVLPIVMGVFFIFQNILTNPDKKNIFFTFIFPIFLTLIFLNFPAGLQLYWLIFNILSILESLIFQKGGFKWLKIKMKPKTSLKLSKKW
ncbi:MAG: membrane protein insertase YidC [candidate division WOR-3 bacterium]|nr:membrane protein insertase YidC [candidate division WOR-3 bacterium]MCX7836993.1 membrane protein insertase YidC [candidate division WOR-3 bacterium]MDW8114071.1 membrane protein insertase YidC [candidate division WOR-3 bacterium]